MESVPWWKNTADRHAVKGEMPKMSDGSYDTTYDPSLVTGRCRCKACQAGLDAGYRPSLTRRK